MNPNALSTASSDSGVSAVNDQFRAGDKRGFIRGEEQDTVGDLLGLRCALHRRGIGRRYRPGAGTLLE